VNSGIATVSDISGNLPNVPVNAVLADPDVSNTIYVGTDVGVFFTGDGGVTWSPLVAGLPRAAVLGLAFQRAGRLLVAATHGRSMWTIAAPVTAPNPVPAVASLTPAGAPAASGAFNLTVNGTNFVTTSQVQWNGTARSTTFVSSTQLVAAIAAADIGAAGSAQVAVVSPTPGGGTSNAVSFTINSAAAPDISNLSPGTATAGSATNFTLTVNGSGFSTNSVVQWNGSARSTIFTSSTQLQAALNAADFAAVGAVPVSVVTPAQINSLTSNTVDFYVTAPGALPLAKQAYWPHIVSGAGYVTKMTITNLKPANNDVIVFFFSTSGAALPAMSFTLAPGETSRFSTPESARFGAANITWAIVNSQDTVGLNLFFEVEDPNTGAVVNAVGFNDQAALTDMTVPLEIQPAAAGASAGRTVGLAFANPDPTATATITLNLLDRKGNVLVTAPITLGPRSHTALDVQSFPPFAAVLPNADFIGSLTISSSVPIAVSGLLDDLGPFSALPPMPGRAK